MLKSNNSIIVSVICIVLGLILISNNYIKGKIDKAYSNMNIQLLALNDEDNTTQEIVVPEVENVLDVKETMTIEKKDNYVGKLSIPKIYLERELIEINSKYNSVDYGIETLKGSTYPDTLNGNLILLSHSGNSYRSHFKNLYKLVIGDLCYIEYNNKTYTFMIKNIYNKPKIGKVAIVRNYNKTTLTLITCTKNSKSEQTIYIAELI